MASLLQQLQSTILECVFPHVGDRRVVVFFFNQTKLSCVVYQANVPGTIPCICHVFWAEGVKSSLSSSSPSFCSVTLQQKLKILALILTDGPCIRNSVLSQHLHFSSFGQMCRGMKEEGEKKRRKKRLSGGVTGSETAAARSAPLHLLLAGLAVNQRKRGFDSARLSPGISV